MRLNDPQWRTKECYKRNLELASERLKRLEEAGDAMVLYATTPTKTAWKQAKEVKP